MNVTMDNQQATYNDPVLRLAYVSGFLEATLGSPNFYSRSQLLNKIRHVVKVLRDYEQDGQLANDIVHTTSNAVE